MTPTLEQTCGARLPPSSLAALADLRREPGLVVTITDGAAWLRWPPGNDRVLRRVLSVPGVELYDHRDGLWYAHDHRLPAFGLPWETQGGVMLSWVILPAPCVPEGPSGGLAGPSRVRLVRDDRPRAATTLRCGLDALARWAGSATTAQLSGLIAARCGDLALLRGRALPPIAEGERFWGERVLSPLGFRPEPDLPERAIRQALDVDEDDLLLIEHHACEVVALDAFGPLSRAGVRLAGEGMPA